LSTVLTMVLKLQTQTLCLVSNNN